MDFEFSPEQQAFAEEVEQFLDEHDDPDVFDLTRENMAQIVDTPKRRAFMAQARRARAGSASPGRRSTAAPRAKASTSTCSTRRSPARGGPQIGKGVGIIGKTLIADGERLPEGRSSSRRSCATTSSSRSATASPTPAPTPRRCGSRPSAAERDGKPGWILNGQKTWTTSAHFAEWYWLGTRTDPDDKHRGITLMLVPLDQPGITINGIWTMGDERTNEVFIDDVFVPDEYVVGEVEPRLPVHLAGARPRAVHDVHVLADQAAPRPAVRLRARPPSATASRCGRPGRPPRASRSSSPTPRSPACSGLRVVAASMKGEKMPGTPPPTVESSQYKLFATEFSRRLAERVDGHRRARARSCGCRPRTRRWRAGPSRPTATR